jgi:hypothetical protein
MPEMQKPLASLHIQELQLWKRCKPIRSGSDEGEQYRLSESCKLRIYRHV